MRRKLLHMKRLPRAAPGTEIFELQLQEFGRGFGAAQQHELDSLRTLYPDLPLDPSDPLMEIMEAFAAVRQQSSATSG
jgi:hypothetical protein